MSALRKFAAPVAPNAGHRWDYLMKVSIARPDLSTDAKIFLTMLLGHDNAERLVNPGLRRLADMCSMSVGRCMAARDELMAAGLITCILGSGKRSTVYQLVALDAWFAGWVEARSSVPDSLPSVQDSGSSVHPVQTNPSEPPEPKKTAPPVLRMVPSKGWAALTVAVEESLKLKEPPPDAHKQHLWLKTMTLDRTDADGIIYLSTNNPAAAGQVRELLNTALRDLAEHCGVKAENVRIRGPRCGKAPPAPDTVPLTASEQDRTAEKLEAASDGPIETLEAIQQPAFPPDSNVTSLAAFRTKHDGEARTGGPQQESWEDDE